MSCAEGEIMLVKFAYGLVAGGSAQAATGVEERAVAKRAEYDVTQRPVFDVGAEIGRRAASAVTAEYQSA